MNNIQELEKQLEIAKKQQLKENWEKYLNDVKSFIAQLQNKTVINHYSNGRFILFKVIGCEEKYYANREGYNGQWAPCRWLEIKTSSYITCRVADHRGNWYGDSGITHAKGDLFKAVVYKSRSFPKELTMSEIEYREGSASESCLGLITDVTKIGYTEYMEYREEPNSSRALDKFLLFTHIAPEGMWESAKAIADDNFIKTKLFWEKFESELKNTKPLRDEIPFNK